MDPTSNIIIALTGIAAVIVSLITALSSAKQSAFNDLKKVVDDLRMSLKDEKERGDRFEDELRIERKRNDKLEQMLNEERHARQRVERWARQLVNQLEENNIHPVDLMETDPHIMPIKKGRP